MLIQRKPIAVRNLSVRTDIEAYQGICSLSEMLNSSPSVLLRLAIADLLRKQARVGATHLAELIAEDAS